MKTELINQEVNVTAIRFTRQFDPIPKRIEFGGRAINFIDEGIRLSIKRGENLTRLFDMSDGESNFRLRQATGQHGWKLVSISR